MKILIDDLDGASLVIARPTGIFYTRQVGGVNCLHGSMEGVLAPFSSGYFDAPESLAHRLGALFKDHPYLDDERADAIDDLLAEEPWTAFIRVDRERLRGDDESVEAWVHVTVDCPPEPDPSLRYPEIYQGANIVNLGAFFGFGKCRAVLTWQNSD